MTFNYPDWSDLNVLADPYTHYDKILHQNPFGFDERTKSWLVASYEDCFQLLKDPRLTVERAPLYRALLPQHPKIDRLISSLEHWLVFVDGPNHERLRAPIMRTIASQTQRLAKAQIEIETAAILENLPDHGDIDLVHDVAYKLPIHVICRLLGLPLTDSEFLLKESKKVAYFFERSADISIATNAAEGFAALESYFSVVISDKAQLKEDDLLSGLLALRAELPDLTVADIIGNAIFLLAAGHETATSLISSTFGLLLTNPDELALLKAQPSLVPSAVEEALRLEPPVQRNGRLVREDFSWKGQQLRKGQWVMILMAAANRDPAIFPDPHRFIINRDKPRHLSFSNGPHYCAGAHLGRMEAAAMIDMTLRLFPNITMREPTLSYLPNQTFRCLSRLPVRLGNQITPQKRPASPEQTNTATNLLVDRGRHDETSCSSQNP
jgi:cytochrome P450